MTSTDPDGQFGDLEIDIDPQAASNSLHKLLNCAYPPRYFDRLDGHRSEWFKAGISSKERVTLEEGFAKEQRRLHRLHADHIIDNGHPDALETELFSVYQSAMADIECYEGVVFAEGTVPGFKGCPPSLNWHTLHNLPSDEEFNTLYPPPPLGPKMRALLHEQNRKLAEVSPDEEPPQSDKVPEPPICMAHLARSLDQVEADLRAQGAKTAQPLPQQTPVKTAVQAGGTTKIVPPQVKPQEPLTQVRAERSGEPESDPKAEPEEGEASEDSGSYSTGERDFLLNRPAFIHMQQLNEFKAMPDWKDFLKPLRVPDEMTVTGMVRAFA